VITIAGKPIVVDHQHQLKSFLADRLPPEEILFSRWQSNPVLTNPLVCDNAPDYIDSPYPTLPPLSIGELQWPTGASRYARALYAVDYLTLRAIAIDAWGWEPPTDLIDPEGDEEDPENQIEVALDDIPDSWGSTFYEVDLVITGEETFTAPMFALRPYRVTGSGADLWLLPLVDARWKASHKAYEPSTQPEDMEALIEDLATAAGLTITIDAATITGSLDRRLWKAEQPAVNLLDIACLSSGLRVVRDPSGAVRAISQSASETRRDARLAYDWKILAGGTRGPTELPPSVRVHCRQEGDTKFHVQAASITGGLSVGGSSLAVWSSWMKTSSNGAETAAFAAQIAASIAAWSNCGGQYCLAGPINFVSTGYDDFVSIIQEESSPEEYRFQTVVRELPGVFLPRAILIGGVEEDCCDCDKHYLFTLDENMTSVGGMAEIRTMDDLTQIDDSALVVNTLGDFDHLLVEARGVCVKVDGVYYAVHPEDNSGSGDSVGKGHVFALTANLAGTVGSTATASVIVSGESGVAISDPITVHNTGGKKSVTGAVGFAVKIGNQYWISEIDQYPILSEVVLDADTHTFSPAATVQGKVADQDTISVSSMVALTPYPFSFVPDPFPTITNPHNLIGLDGDKAIVQYNEDEDEFQLFQVMPASKRRMRFRLSADMPTETITSTVNFVILETREFTAGEVSVPGSISDPMKLIVNGEEDDQGVIEYSYRETAWQVVSFRKRDSDNCILIKTPGGGIPACTGTGPYTFGSATCTIVNEDGTVSADTVTVKNIVNQAIDANVIGKAERVGATYIIDVASCGA
jgi:hypothetical protein